MFTIMINGLSLLLYEVKLGQTLLSYVNENLIM